MSRQVVARVSTLLLWGALWILVLALDANLDFATDSPLLVLALLVVPQLALGYVVGPWALLVIVPPAAAWAPLAHADCVANGAECGSPVLPALGLAVAWGALIALGYGLRVIVQPRRKRQVTG